MRSLDAMLDMALAAHLHRHDREVRAVAMQIVATLPDRILKMNPVPARMPATGD